MDLDEYMLILCRLAFGSVVPFVERHQYAERTGRGILEDCPGRRNELLGHPRDHEG